MTERLSNDMKAADYSFVAENIELIRQRIAAAALRAGREASEITLVAVTKTHPAEAVNAALSCGVKVIGENRVQELLQKLPGIEEGPHQVHLIGHLQTNKVRQIIDRVDMIQSLDSLHLAQEIDRQAQKIGKIMDVLVEVNIGGEQAKSGVAPEEAADFITEISKYGGLRVCGMMTVPPICENIEETRPFFVQMRKLFIDIKNKKLDNNNMHILSMGMSSDFEVAIEEGANMVRVGTSIFGRRKYKEAVK